MSARESRIHIVTEDDYLASVARIQGNIATDDDINLVRAWEQAHWAEQRNAIERVVKYVEALI